MHRQRRARPRRPPRARMFGSSGTRCSSKRARRSSRTRIDGGGSCERSARRASPPRSAEARRARESPVVCVSGDLFYSGGAGEQLEGLARLTRERLSEAARELGVALPVYVVFTKSDRIPHFENWAAPFTNDEIRAPVGASLPFDKPRRKREPRAPAGTPNVSHRGSTPGWPASWRRWPAAGRSFSVARASPNGDSPHTSCRVRWRSSRRRCPDSLRRVVPAHAPRREPAAAWVLLCGRASGGHLRRCAHRRARRLPRGRRAHPTRRAYSRRRRSRPPRRRRRTHPRRRAASLSGSSSIGFCREVILARSRCRRGGDRWPESGACASRGARSRHRGGAHRVVRRHRDRGSGIARSRTAWQPQRRAVAALPVVAAPGGAVAFPSVDALGRLEALRATLDTVRAYGSRGVPLRLRWGLWRGDALLASGRRVWLDGYRRQLHAATWSALVDSLRTLPALPRPTDDYGRDYGMLKAYLIMTGESPRSTPEFLAPVMLTSWAARPGARRRHHDARSRAVRVLRGGAAHGKPVAAGGGRAHRAARASVPAAVLGRRADLPEHARAGQQGRATGAARRGGADGARSRRGA